MTEFWISTPRHFCTFCKCWIADNKPSKDFHEKGKRHQESVKKRIDDMQKKSREKAEVDAEMDNTMKEIERKARAAFKKDVDANPSLAAAYKRKLKEKEDVEASKAPVQGCEAPPPGVQPSSSSVPPPNESASPWQIAFSDEGYPYFWNIETNEVRWTKPDDYEYPYKNEYGSENTSVEEVSVPEIAEVEPEIATPEQKLHKSAPKAAKEVEEACPKVDAIPLPKCTAEIPLPPPPNAAPPEVRELPVLAPEPDQRTASKLPSSKAYGVWESIPESVQQEEEVDLQLPTVEKTHEEKTITLTNEPKFKIRTKKSNPITDGLVAFKKRKLGQGARNIKRREDDR